MSYLILPMNRHSDLGFGAMADAYYDASVKLKSENGMFIHLPQLFLLRHSIELYLKSQIIVLRLKFQQVSVDESIHALSNEHNIRVLFLLFKTIFNENLTWLNENTETQWNLPDDVDEKINLISSFDSNSTVLRYPTTRNHQSDEKKDKIKKVSKRYILRQLKSYLKKTMITIFQNGSEEEIFDTDSEIDPEVITSLKYIGSFLHGNHFALRHNLFQGI